MMSFPLRAATWGLLAVLLAEMGMAASAAGYPDRPILLVAPYSRGGASDLAARALAEVVPKYIGQSVEVINRPGAGGVAGASFVRYSQPDGYTLLLARIGANAVAPAMKANLPYRHDDFTFLGVLEQNPVACVTAVDKPIRTFPDLIETIERNPGRLSYASAGVGTLLQIAVVLILDTVGVPSPAEAAVHVPFASGGAATEAVLNGRVDFICTNLSPLIPHINRHELRALLVTTPQRSAAIPRVPTAGELGYPELEILVGWSALAGPPGLSSEVVETWTGALQHLEKDHQWQRLADQRGAIAKILRPEETEAFVSRQYRIFADAVSKLNLWVR